jgi:hypothetical protein
MDINKIKDKNKRSYIYEDGRSHKGLKQKDTKSNGLK